MKAYLGSVHHNGELRAAAIIDDLVVDIETSLGIAGSTRSLLSRESGFLAKLFVDAQVACMRGEVIGRTDEVRFGPPIHDPQKIVCLGLNYRDHAAEANLPLPKQPVLFAKYVNSLIGASDDVIVPRAAQAAVDYEVELAVIIGKRTARVATEDALNFVAGYTVFNDISARDLQMNTSQWGAGKAIDTFGPIGPYLVTPSDLGDPQSLVMSTRVNGITVQQGNTSQMIFSVAQTIAYVSSFMTLEPGDIIATGTPAGIGFARKPPLALKSGDIVEVEIERIGVLRNAVVWES